ncbi:transporter [Geobacter argillaceus]|uniref:Outer membrane putative beta-barrel porin/alpha-amylase n=1 Tax=Geobacter argillaceus TaxID=345631 RepID=A0A562VPK3_9BACT|nr:transporter [Geobacter argillaceus]TWJ19762.1 outer membrane putative beta-barrel porin/alpha-amylase [Geobacter argillaceus]
MAHNLRIDRLFLLLAVFTVLAFPAWCDAEGPKYSVSQGFEFASGEYGTGIRTDSIFMPLTLAVNPTQRLDFSLEIPLVYQSTSAVVAGEFMGMQRASTGSTMQAASVAMVGSGMGSSPMTNATAANVGDSQFGLGDMKLRTGYVLYTEEEYIPSIRPNFYVKFPTADKGKFLGTGAFDTGFAVELTKWIGNWVADGEAGYAIQGKSSVLAVKNYLYYYAGGGYQLTEKLRPMLFLKGSTAPVEGTSSLLEARLRVKYQLTKHTGIDGYLAKGITTASPDYGMGIAVSYEF